MPLFGAFGAPASGYAGLPQLCALCAKVHRAVFKLMNLFSIIFTEERLLTAKGRGVHQGIAGLICISSCRRRFNIWLLMPN